MAEITKGLSQWKIVVVNVVITNVISALKETILGPMGVFKIRNFIMIATNLRLIADKDSSSI
jgi:hypothetical protein